jgi:hypothetical protein
LLRVVAGLRKKSKTVPFAGKSFANGNALQHVAIVVQEFEGFCGCAGATEAKTEAIFAACAGPSID